MKQQAIKDFVKNEIQPILPKNWSQECTLFDWDGCEGYLIEVTKHYSKDDLEYPDWPTGQVGAGAFITFDPCRVDGCDVAMQIDYDDWEYGKFTTEDILDSIKSAIKHV